SAPRHSFLVAACRILHSSLRTLRVEAMISLLRCAEPIEAGLAFKARQPLVERRRAVAERGAGEPGEFVREFAGFEEAAVDMAHEMPPVGERHRDRAAHRAAMAAMTTAALFRNEPDAP